MGEVLLCLVSVIVILLGHWVYRWRNPKFSNGKLPPGSMGYPLIGETLAFIARHDFYGIPPFIRTRTARYGPIFKTNLVGKPTIVSTDSEFNHYIFQQEGKLFQLMYTESFTEIIGNDTMTKYHGMLHKYLRNLVFNQVSPQRLKDKLVTEMNGKIRDALSSWTSRPDVDVREAVADIIFEFIAWKMFGYDESKEKMNLISNYKDFMAGRTSFPLNFPGTTYHSCLKGRRIALKMIQDKYEERKASGKRGDDFLDVLIGEVEKKDAWLSKASTAEIIFVLLFGAYETASRVIALLVKFITENPSTLTKLTEEHEEILRVRGTDTDDDGESGVTWEEYKSMSFTHMVITETLRLANVVPGIFRRATQDIEINGYTIPKGWAVMISPGAVHLDPNNFEDPLKFNPWRWKGEDMHAASKNFMPFGGGLRHCVGADFAKVEMAIFVHYLVTCYRWKIIGGGEVVRSPGVSFPNGFHIRIWNKLQ